MMKLKKLLAAMLVTSMLFGSNYISYAAESAEGNTNGAAQETALEEDTAEKTQAKTAEKADTAEEAQAKTAEDAETAKEAEPVEEAQAKTAEDAEPAQKAQAETAEEAEHAQKKETSEEADTAHKEETVKDAKTPEKAENSEEAHTQTAEEAETVKEEAAAEKAQEAESAQKTEAEAAKEATAAETSESVSEGSAEAASEQPAAEETFAAGELTYKGTGYSVTMSYNADAKIPADAELKVREIKKGTSEYDSYLKGAEAASDKGVAEARFFDISIWARGQEIQPQSAVRVSVSYNNAIEVENEGQVTAMHFKDSSGKAEVLDTDTNDGSEVSEIAFDAESFSVYGIVYTVDFTYEGFTFTMPGGGSVLLSILAGELNLYEKDYDKAFSIDNVSKVEFTDYDLVKIDKQADGDWLLASLASFESKETLTITMKDGVKFVISVTDPPKTQTQISSDLTNFLTKVIIQGATQNSDGRYEVKPGTDYSLIANFAESTEYQFRNNAELTYQMPQGIAILSEQTGPLKVNIVYKGSTYEVDASYRLTTDGQLTVKFDENDPDYSKLVSSTDVRFRFTYSAQFDGSSTEIKFNDVVERDIIFNEPEPGQAYVSKNAQYDEKTGRFTYTIKVNATGDVTNVNVKDVLSGNALVFNNDVRVSGNSSDYTDKGAANGFDYTFDSMREGEEITITYSANVDFSKDTDKDGRITADQTKNTVTVEPEGGEPHKAEYQREISFKTTSKGKGNIAGTDENGDKIIEWEITHNPLAVASAAGDTITDSIEADSAYYMTYYGDGLTVSVYDRSGNLVRTDYVSFDQLTDYNASSWTYTIPDSDSFMYYSYVITYQTIVDMEKVNGGGAAVTLINDANGSGESIVVTPDYRIGVRKDVESFSTEEVSWISTISVPENGLAQAVATDTLPHVYLHNRFIYDTYKDGSLEITGLENGETYDVTYSADKVVITFYKDAGKTQTGLQAVEGGHTITVKLTTKVDQEWLKAGYDGGETEPDWTTYLMNHTNTFGLNTVTDTATVVFDKPDMKKSAEIFKDEQGKVSRILYSIVLSGVSDTPVSIEDTFDTSILEIDTSMSGGWDHFRIWGGNQDVQIAGHLPVSYSETAEGVLITANSIPMQSSGSYYSHYKISYYLKLRDGIDLDQLAVANGGEYDLVNTAKWNGHESSFTYKTEYDYLDKQLLNEGELGGTNRTAKYRITFNRAQAVLNGGEPMEMTDTLSANLSIDYGSISITTVPENEKVSYSLRGGADGETIATYTVPDATEVVIEYDALVVGNGQQTIVNKVSINGKDETVDNTKEYGSASEGEGAVASFKIVKVDGYDAGKKLPGVKFRLFSENGLYFDDDNTVSEVFLTTDENGEAVIDGQDINFYFNEVYHLQEVKGPDDYGKIGFDYLVTLTNDMALVDYPHFIYYFSDSMQIKNWPLEGLVVEKQVKSSEKDDLDRYYNFRVSILKEDGTVDTDYNEKNGDDQFEDGVVEFELKNGEQKMFRGFEKGTKYKVEEILTDDEGNVFTTTVSYDIFDEEGGVIEHKTETVTSHSGELTQEDETLVFTNTRSETGSLKIKKNVTVNGKSTTGKLADGTYEFTITGPGKDGEVEKTVEITVENGAAVSAKADGKDTALDSDGYVEVTDLEAGEYTVTETAPANGTALMTDNNIVLTVEAGKAGEDVPETAIGSFTNNYAVGSAVLSAKKAANTDLGDAEFRFELLNAAGDVIETSDPVKQGETATFTAIEYTQKDVGEHIYTIREEIPGDVDENNKLNGITYDTHERTVTVKVEDPGDGTLTITYDGDPSFQTEEFSNTYAAEGGISLHAAKEFTGRPWMEDDQFEFTLAADPENPSGAILPEKTTVTATKDEQTVTFDEIRFTKEGFYKFTITETKGDLEGVAYDTAPKTITVAVADKGDGTLTAVPTPDTATVTAYNVYNANGEISLGAEKVLTGRDWTENDKFEFTLAADEHNPEGATMPDTVVKTATSDARTVTFDPIRFKEAGDYIFTITETNGGLSGVTYDTAPKTVRVSVSDNGDGTLTAKADPESAKVTVENTYEASGAIKLHAAKKFTGRDWTEDDKFEFTLAADPENPSGAELPENTTATATKDEQTVTFDEIRFTKPGTYKFTITESRGDLKGVSYDTAPKTITVTVTDNGDGTLTAKADPESAKVTVENTYEANGAIKLHAAKEFTGRDWTEDDKFEFTLAADPENPSGAELPENTTATATKDEQTVTFDEIRFTKAGFYTFTITETRGDLKGVAYDTAPKTITVAVTDNGDGTLTAVPTPDTATVTAYNVYNANGEISLGAEKVLTGRDWTEDDKFEFTLAADPENPEGATLPETVTATATKDEQTVTFDEIRFTKPGTYKFTITESRGDLKGVSYDTAPKTITVTVTDNGDGTLTAEADPESAKVTIENTYEASGAIKLHAAKEFTGRDWTEDDKFEFTLAADPENPSGAELPENTTATATKDEQTVTFDEIRFTKAGFYTFTITETKGDLKGVAYDTAPKTITVAVTDNGDGTLTAVPTPDTATVTAYNVYNANGEISLGAEKVLTGRDWTENDNFEFTLAADENNPEGATMPDTVVKTATSDARTVTFDPIRFKEAGDYIFTITETNGGLSGVTYDTAPKTVRVSVTDNGDGTLTAKADPESAKVTVKNTYEANGAIKLHAAKEFTGRDWTEDDKFEFTLAADPENPESATLPETVTATATKDEQTVTFDEIRFTKPGTYKFTITESRGDLKGVSYDTAPKTITVTVTDNGDGTLTAKADPESAKVTVENTYEASGAIKLHAAKEFTGRDWTEDDKFKFTLAADPENPEGATLPETVTATATKDEQTVTFDEIRFTKEGLYKFTITETMGDLEGVAYDTAPKTITVAVADKGDGTLTAVPTPDTATVTAHNIYQASNEISLGAEKVLTGREWTENDRFEFTLAEDENNPEGAILPDTVVKTAARDARTVTFDPIRFKEAGDYIFTITETDGGLGGVTYDTAPKTIKVSVRDNGDGTLTAKADPESAKVTAENTYASEGEIVLKTKKELKGRHITLDEDVFEFQLMDEGGTVLQTAKNDAFGNVEFNKISYTQEDIKTWDAEKGTGTGTKKYTVKELVRDKNGYTFDDSEFEITVTLTDDGKGTIEAEADKSIDDLIFTNEYKAEGEIVLHAKKVFISENELKEGQFTFELKDADGNVLDTKSNAADGTVTFDAIKYTQNDIYITDETGAYTGEVRDQYKYTISEVIPEGAEDNGDGTFNFEGYTYDGTVYTITVILTDKGDGTITAVDAADQAGSADGTAPAEGGEEPAQDGPGTESRYVFTNAYAADGTLKLDAEKTFKNGVLQGGEFTFELKDADGNVLQSKKNDAAGKVSFDMIAYTLADAAKAPYIYTVSEATGTKSDVNYDPTVYTVTVSLKDKGNGELEVTKEIDKGGELKFVNEQLDVETSIEIGGVKVFKGQTLKKDQFKFIMVDENGKTVGEAGNDADGNFTFGKITYRLSDLNGSNTKIYTYSISEVEGNDKSIIYDKNVYTVTVTVRYEDGKMTASASKERADIKFVNDYTKVQVSKIDKLTKKELAGAKLCIFDKDGKTVQKWTSGKEPHMIERLQPGTYTLHEILAPNGYETAKDVKFTVRETGKLQKVTMVDAPKSKKKHSSGGSSKGGKTRRSRKTPGTGDTANIFVWILLLVLSSVMSGAVWYMKKKMEKDANQRR